MSLQEIIDWDLAVPMSKLVKVTGYSRLDIMAIDPPFVCKKIRPSSFWKHVEKIQKQYRPHKADTGWLPPKYVKALHAQPKTEIGALAQRIMA